MGRPNYSFQKRQKELEKKKKKEAKRLRKLEKKNAEAAEGVEVLDGVAVEAGAEAVEGETVAAEVGDSETATGAETVESNPDQEQNGVPGEKAGE